MAGESLSGQSRKWKPTFSSVALPNSSDWGLKQGYMLTCGWVAFRYTPFRLIEGQSGALWHSEVD